MRVLDARVELVIADDDVDADWQLKDLDARMRPYLDQIRHLNAHMTEALRAAASE